MPHQVETVVIPWGLSRLLASIALLLVTVAGAAGAPRNAAFAPVKDNPNLPRVLLIGDSISIGYTVAVRKQLDGVANVHRIPTNGGPTSRGLASIDKWLGEGKWDVIHFNWGLHDLKYINDQGGLVDVAKGRQQIALEDYESNLEKLVARLKKTGAKLIWCATTPVPQGAKGRVPGDELKYNQAARKVMQEQDVPINDLHAFCAPQLTKIQKKADVHFHPQGSVQLGHEVARHIRSALGVKQPRAETTPQPGSDDK